MERKEILRNLLTAGVCYPYNSNYSITDLNHLVREMGYEVIEWYDKSCLVLKDLEESGKITLPWKKEMVDEAKDIFLKISDGTLDISNYEDKDVFKLLIQKNWIRTENGKVCFTERNLVQNCDFILSVSSKFRKCRICSLLVEDDPIHSYCNNLLENIHRSEQAHTSSNMKCNER
jgi:hypothetical protein